MKRFIDIVGSMLALLLFSPIIGSTAVAVLITMGRPIFFRQARPGKGGRVFQMIKFRTMLDSFDQSGKPLSDGDRLTRTGRFLRAASLDELPELWNVLVGDMSLVGPRPLLVAYLDRYTDEQARRHDVKPGITGWAQVNGRNALSWDEKFALDTWYVENHSVLLDIRILIKTVQQVIRRDGINANNAATMPEFLGKQD